MTRGDPRGEECTRTKRESDDRVTGFVVTPSGSGVSHTLRGGFPHPRPSFDTGNDSSQLVPFP